MNHVIRYPAPIPLNSTPYRQLLEDLREASQGVLLVQGATPVEQEETASVLARDLALDLFRVDLSSIISKYIGNTERELARALSEATESGTTLLLAEADALFGKRVEVDGCFLRYRDTEAIRLFQLGASHSGFVFA